MNSTAKILVMDCQGYYINGKFMPKELAITMDGECVYSYIIKPTVPFRLLSVYDKESVVWLENNHHKIKYSSGYIHVNEIHYIVKKFIDYKNYDCIYVKGNQKENFLQSLKFDVEIINLDCIDDSPKLSNTEHECIHHTCNYSNCAIVNVKTLYKFLE